MDGTLHPQPSPPADVVIGTPAGSVLTPLLLPEAVRGGPREGGQSPPPAPGGSSLDTQETTVRGDFDRFWAEKGSKEEFFTAPVLDEQSKSARFRHGGWWTIRRMVWKSLHRTQASSGRAASFGCCGSYSWIEQSDECSTSFRVRHNRCNDRLCTPCANARSARVKEALFNIVGNKPVTFITLTLCGKNEPLSDLVDRLYKHFRALRLHPLWDENVRGGAAFLEIKWSDKAQRWHPHLHILADAKFIEQGLLSQAWRSISRDSYIVDIRRVKNIEVAGHYVTKYASKPLNMTFASSPDLLDEAVRALKGRRLCLCFGEWYGTPLNSSEDEDLDLDGKEKFHAFCPLEDLLDKATSGDRAAIDILKLAGLETLWRGLVLGTPPPST